MAKIKRTYSLEFEVVERLEEVAKKNRRSLSEQLSIFVEEGLAREASTDEPNTASQSVKKA